jgi:hypothetical protein
MRAVFQFRDLPPQLTFNRPAYEDRTSEYQWIVWVDADGDRTTPAALAGADERTVAIFVKVDGRRERLPSTVDVTAHVVTATTSHFTEFEFAASDLPTPTPLRREPVPTPCPDCRPLYLPVELKTFGGRW